MKLGIFFLFFFTSSLFAEGNYQAGEQKSLACAPCHGAKGMSANPQWPNLAGQHPAYLVKQLEAIKANKNRSVPVMAGVLVNLTSQDFEDLAAFYAKQPVVFGVTPKKYVERGELLYRGGDFEKHITACIACHGPQGTGNAEAGFPLLSGQQPGYTLLQLQQFKDKKRSNDLNAIMQTISGRMSQEDMEAVAYYLVSLH